MPNYLRTSLGKPVFYFVLQQDKQLSCPGFISHKRLPLFFFFFLFSPASLSASWVVPCSVGWMLRGSLFAAARREPQEGNGVAREPQEGTGKQLTQEEHSAETTLDAEPRWTASPRRTPSPRATTCYLTWRKSLHVSINGFLEAQVHMLYVPGQVAHTKSDVQTGAV